jgi:hypothetical protein
MPALQHGLAGQECSLMSRDAEKVRRRLDETVDRPEAGVNIVCTGLQELFRRYGPDTIINEMCLAWRAQQSWSILPEF